MDFAGQSFTFGDHAGLVLGPGEFGTGASKFLGNEPLVFGFPEQGAVGHSGDHSETGPEHWPQNHRKLQSAVGRSPAVEPQCAHQKRRTRKNRRQCDGARQDVQLEEEEWERHPSKVAADQQKQEPKEHHGPEPPGREGRGIERRSSARVPFLHDCPGKVHEGQRSGKAQPSCQGDCGGRNTRARQEPDHGNGQQHGKANVEAHPQNAQHGTGRGFRRFRILMGIHASQRIRGRPSTRLKCAESSANQPFG